MEGMMRIIDQTGDTTVTWDRNDTATVERARAQFMELLDEKKYAAYKITDRVTEDGEQIKQFDATAALIIMRPQMAGG